MDDWMVAFYPIKSSKTDPSIFFLETKYDGKEIVVGDFSININISSPNIMITESTLEKVHKLIPNILEKLPNSNYRKERIWRKEGTRLVSLGFLHNFCTLMYYQEGV